MKILMVSPVPPEFGGISMGGMANAVTEISRYMVSKGHEVTIYAYNSFWEQRDNRYTVHHDIRIASRPGPIRARNPLFIIRNYGLSCMIGAVLKYPKIRHLLNMYGLKLVPYTYIAMGELIFLSSEISNFQPDIIHIHIPNKSTIAVPFLRSCVPVVATVHKHHFADKNPGVTNTEMRKVQNILRMAIPHFAHIIAVSKSVANELVSLGAKRERLSVLPNGVDTEVFRPRDQLDARSKLGINAEKKIVLFVGRIEKIKGVDILIDAWEHVSRKSKDAMLYFIGSGHMQKELKTKIRSRNLGKSIKFVGYVSHNLMPLWYSAADIFCLPSRSEAFPLSLLEAMACGIPCVCAKVSGPKDVISHGKNGLLFSTGSSAKLAETIIKILVDENLRKQLSKGARSTALKYSWNRVIEKTLKIYNTILHDTLI